MKEATEPGFILEGEQLEAGIHGWKLGMFLKQEAPCCTFVGLVFTEQG